MLLRRWLLGGGNKKKGMTIVAEAAEAKADFYVQAEARFGLWEMLVREKRVAEALAGHPRIGERTREGSRSRQEQSGVTGEDTRAALAQLNRTYEDRFGHVYLVCATGRSADELLAMLGDRLP